MLSAWQRTSNTHRTSYFDYDPFARAGTIRPPDGSDHDVTFAFQGIRKVTRTVSIGRILESGEPIFLGDDQVVEAATDRIEEYDIHGRLVSVTEDSAGVDSEIVTRYTYDVGGRLRLASTPLAGGGSQERSWTYDQRGFLLSESHPEKGTDVVYFSYDPLGNAHRRVDGPNDVRFSFDRAGRLTDVEEGLAGGGTRPLKSYAFGTSSTASNWANGKVVGAIGNNHLPVAAGSTEDQRFIETFIYGGVGGRVSHRRVQWSRFCDGGQGCDGGYVDDVAFEHGETYSEIGNRASVTYPECDTGEASCTGEWPREVTSTYIKGRLTGVSGFASSIGYHRNQTLDQVVHANGVTDTYGEDPHKMSRPASITATVGAQTLWTTGDYRYDGAGNILEMGPVLGDETDKYLYDSVSRLVATEFYVPGVPLIFADGFESGDT
ncbi:MAG: hypothetical protein GY722_04930, partial [bacterium]|nr:hypothetical protein [bacterium]